MTAGAEHRPKVMVSSTVYGWEPLLDKIKVALTTFGYDVVMSRAGSVRVPPGMKQFDACLQAVDDCYFFLSIIFPRYGSGRVPGEDAITHQELARAVTLGKPRFTAAHESVVTARRFLGDLGYKTKEEREATGMKITRKRDPLIDDLRLCDMYELATGERLPTGETIALADRVNGWVQAFTSEDQVMSWLNIQFGEVDEMRAFLVETERLKAEAEAGVTA